jgi:nicotinamide mononucleotide adenylyltransferase
VIKKLLNLKKMQLDQQLLQKQQLSSKVFNLEQEINEIDKSLSQAGVKMFGSIGDFKVLAIHKNAMKYEKTKLFDAKNILINQISQIDKKIVLFQKEVEQYNYLLKEELRKKLKEEVKQEQMVADEYMQAKWMINNG